MSIYSDVRAGIRRGALAALSEYTNPQVIFSHSGGTEPAESYVVINILNITAQGGASSSTTTNANLELSISTPYEVYSQISFIGSKSGEMSQSFLQRMSYNPIVMEELSKNSLGLMRKSQIRRAPQKRDTKWVEYHNLDLTFSYIVNTQQVVDFVETAILSNSDMGTFTVPPNVIINP